LDWLFFSKVEQLISVLTNVCVQHPLPLLCRLSLTNVFVRCPFTWNANADKASSIIIKMKSLVLPHLSNLFTFERRQRLYVPQRQAIYYVSKGLVLILWELGAAEFFGFFAYLHPSFVSHCQQNGVGTRNKMQINCVLYLGSCIDPFPSSSFPPRLEHILSQRDFGMIKKDWKCRWELTLWPSCIYLLGYHLYSCWVIRLSLLNVKKLLKNHSNVFLSLTQTDNIIMIMIEMEMISIVQASSYSAHL